MAQSEIVRCVEGMLARTESRRRRASGRLQQHRRHELGQFFTPPAVADRVVSLPAAGLPQACSLLDPGAGTGMLTAALVARLVRERLVEAIEIVAVEVDTTLLPELRETLEDCVTSAERCGVEVSYRIEVADFVPWAVGRLLGTLDNPDPAPSFDIIIQNPPYRKIGRGSPHSLELARAGIEVPNLYAAFLSLGARLLGPGGQMSAITPRSFANGAYFRPFRRDLFTTVAVQQIRNFHDRGALFADSSVLQENIILSVARKAVPEKISILTARTHADQPVERLVAYEEVIQPGDPEMFLHIPTDADDDRAGDLVGALPATLADLNVAVSTGRVVDFRAREHLRSNPELGTVPLIYPGHLRNGRVRWPLDNFRKPNALSHNDATRKLLLPAGHYVVVKRFSSKEEVRRIVATVVRPRDLPAEWIGFENHLNVFHSGHRGLTEELALGLAGWLNSTVVDLHFRRFSGHTQVNATDLRNLRYPRRTELTALGHMLRQQPWPDQAALDRLVESHVLHRYAVIEGNPEPVPEQHEERIAEARQLLRALNFDAERSNERSALVFLALLDLAPDTPWAAASNPALRTVEIMDFLRRHYGRDYKPNTRETVRRQTLHQFADAALLVQNPGFPDRPINSPNWCYQVSSQALQLIRTFRTAAFEDNLRDYLAEVPGLMDAYAAERRLRRIPVTLSDGREVRLSPGGQNELIERIVADFCGYYTPGGKVLYIGDADEKWAHFDQPAFARLGIRLDEHGKMPDLVVYMPDRDWLILLEAASSHGPVDAKRHGELKTLFAAKANSLVFVSCFPTRAEMRKHLASISWETEVWCADAPTHIIHFNGDRFLGPYER